MRGQRISYSAAEMDWLEENRMMVISDYHQAFGEKFGRPEISAMNLHGLRKRMGWKTGRTGRFVKGQKAHNKGVPCAPGKGGRHPNARKTQFKRGNISHTYRGAGHERIDAKDGYVVMIVDEVNPWTGGKTRPVHKHVYLWEQLNGPVPDGQCLKCLDGDKTNTHPSNWELISRGVLSRLNGGRHKKRVAFDAAPSELKPTLMAVARLEQGIHDKRKVQA